MKTYSVITKYKFQTLNSYSEILFKIFISNAFRVFFIITISSCGIYQPSTINVDTSPLHQGETTSNIKNTSFSSKQSQQKLDKNLDQNPDNSLILNLFSSKTQGIVGLNQSGQVLRWADSKSRSEYILSISKRIYASDLKNDLLAIATAGKISIFSLSLRKELHQQTRIKAQVASLSFEPQNDSLVIGTANGNIYRWLFSKKTEFKKPSLEHYPGHASIVNSVIYLKTGKVFFSGDENGVFSAWASYAHDPNYGKYDKNKSFTNIFLDKSQRYTAKNKLSLGIESMSQINNDIALSRTDGTIEIWKIRGFTKTTEAQAHASLIYQILACGKEKEFYSTGRDGFLKKWKISPDKKGEKEIKLLGEKKFRKVGPIVCHNDKLVLADKNNLKITNL